MNDNVTISTFQLFKMFPDEETARTYLESRLWPNGVKCPVCSAEKDRIKEKIMNISATGKARTMKITLKLAEKH